MLILPGIQSDQPEPSTSPMKLCSKCDNSPLPFIMAFVIATVSAFMTWLTLGLSIDEVVPRAVASALAFTVIGGTLLMYILNCLKRHCPHEDGQARDPRMSTPVRPPEVQRALRRANLAGVGELGASA